jgi:hypothetical protein
MVGAVGGGPRSCREIHPDRIMQPWVGVVQEKITNPVFIIFHLRDGSDTYCPSEFTFFDWRASTPGGAPFLSAWAVATEKLDARPLAKETEVALWSPRRRRNIEIAPKTANGWQRTPPMPKSGGRCFTSPSAGGILLSKPTLAIRRPMRRTGPEKGTR